MKDQESLTGQPISPLPLIKPSRAAAINHDALDRLTYKHGGHKPTLSRKLDLDTKKHHILHRYASVTIFDKFDYEKKLEEAIERNYFENNYEHYLF